VVVVYTCMCVYVSIVCAHVYVTRMYVQCCVCTHVLLMYVACWCCVCTLVWCVVPVNMHVAGSVHAYEVCMVRRVCCMPMSVNECCVSMCGH
jgi:hypothetical protein